jgi:hypothetical protein
MKRDRSESGSEKLRQFTQEVLERVARKTNKASGHTTTVDDRGNSIDIQETIDSIYIIFDYGFSP